MVREHSYPPGFFGRDDEQPDSAFYATPRLVTHIDEGAIAAVGSLYDELEVSGRVLDLMSSWVSHFRFTPSHLTVLGMNEVELSANAMADQTVVHDLNKAPRLPFPDEEFDDVVCCVSVDYLTDPVSVFADIARVLRPSGRVVITFSNRCFPTKAIRGWLASTDEQHVEIVADFLSRSGAFVAPSTATRIAPGLGQDPLFAVWAARR